MLFSLTSWGTVQLTEVIWTVLGVLGGYITWLNATDAKRYIDALRAIDGNTLKMHQQMQVIAVGHYREEMLRLIKFVIITSVGIAAMFSPPADPARPISALSLTVTLGFFGLVITMLVASLLDKRQRELMYDLYKDSG